MTAESFNELKLRAEFPPVATADWEAVIQKDLKGADYDKRLKWRTDEGIVVKPYYRAEDLPVTAPAPAVRAPGQPWSTVTPGHEPELDVDAAPYHEQGGTAVQEVAFALAAGAAKVVEGKTPTWFGVRVGSNYFMEIAKLRALRMCWAQVIAAFGLPPAEMKIHCRTATANKTLYDPCVNLLRVTTEGLSAVLGGCDSLCIEPAHFDAHLAENVQHILREESSLDRVADPGAGSYYIEALTDGVARAAWKLFQQVEAAGGLDKYPVAGELKKSREAKEKAVASRRNTIVGTNNFPNPQDRALAESATAPASWRLAATFEKIRLRTERHAQATGKTPRVLLLEKGDLKMRKARSTFCQNFFGCAGFDIVASDELQDADLVVLCSSDPEYLELAQAVCPKTKAPVVVAGNPSGQIDALKQAGVADFVHVQSNAVDTLTQWQDRLGVRS